MTHATDPRPCSSFSAARKENTFVLLCSSMCKSKCQIHHITGRREITANEIQHAHSERPWWVLVSPAGDTWRGGSDSSLTGEGTLVLGLQLTVMIRRDRCLSVWTRKTMSNGAFDVLLYLLCCLTFQNTDYFNGKLGNSYARPYFKTFFILHYKCIHNVLVLDLIFLENHFNHYPVNIEL